MLEICTPTMTFAMRNSHKHSTAIFKVLAFANCAVSDLEKSLSNRKSRCAREVDILKQTSCFENNALLRSCFHPATILKRLCFARITYPITRPTLEVSGVTTVEMPHHCERLFWFFIVCFSGSRLQCTHCIPLTSAAWAYRKALGQQGASLLKIRIERLH